MITILQMFGIHLGGQTGSTKDVQFKTEKDIVQISAYHNGYNKLTRKLLHKENGVQTVLT